MVLKMVLNLVLNSISCLKLPMFTESYCTKNDTNKNRLNNNITKKHCNFSSFFFVTTVHQNN